jgi:hypothetical protein
MGWCAGHEHRVWRLRGERQGCWRSETCDRRFDQKNTLCSLAIHALKRTDKIQYIRKSED